MDDISDVVYLVTYEDENNSICQYYTDEPIVKSELPVNAEVVVYGYICTLK